tara:strand:+ start:93 stop:215 length:123 start_codon:yes stop_codon:yes gene_type:complete
MIDTFQPLGVGEVQSSIMALYLLSGSDQPWIYCFWFRKEM